MRTGLGRRSILVAAIVLALSGLFVQGAPRAEAQLFPSTPPGIAPIEGPAPEFRGLWVDAYHDGFKTPEQVDRLLADARRANVNALIVQVRRRGDAYYARGPEPRTEDPSLAAGFDVLDYLIDRAHNGSPRLEVHAWIVTLPIWGGRETGPRDPAHAFNQHGTGAVGRDDWLMRRDDGETWANGYFLDPGHPDAARYTAEVALNLVREYDVDGLHLDYVRYYEGGSATGGWDRRWGYNETSVARFNARYGREGRPGPNDPEWAQWRRDQVTALVRRIYLETTGLKPRVKVSAAVIPWGPGPRTTAEWSTTAAYDGVFQDWRAWLEEGILDLVMPMNYYRESQAPQPAWFDRWIAWQREHSYGRQIAPGVALYLNSPSEGLGQVRRALGSRGSGLVGVALYSYAANRRAPAHESSSVDANADIWAGLTAPGALNGSAPPFGAPAPTPPMAWKVSPRNGAILVRVPDGDGATIELSGPFASTCETDGNGVCGIASVPPGHYELTVRQSTRGARSGQLEVAPGTLAQLDLP